MFITGKLLYIKYLLLPLVLSGTCTVAANKTSEKTTLLCSVIVLYAPQPDITSFPFGTFLVDGSLAVLVSSFIVTGLVNSMRAMLFALIQLKCEILPLGVNLKTYTLNIYLL